MEDGGGEVKVGHQLPPSSFPFLFPLFTLCNSLPFQVLLSGFVLDLWEQRR